MKIESSIALMIAMRAIVCPGGLFANNKGNENVKLWNLECVAIYNIYIFPTRIRTSN